MRFIVLAALLLPALLTNSVQAQAPVTAPVQRPPKISAVDFAQQPFFGDPKLSPDGSRLMYRYRKNAKDQVVVQDLTGTGLKIYGVPEKNEIAWYRWAGNDRILMSVAKTVPWFDDEARATRLLLVDLKSGEIKFLGRKEEGLEGDDVLRVDPEGQWLLLSIQQTIYDYPSVYRVDLNTGEMTQIVRQRSDVWEWFADEKGVVRFGLGFMDRRWTMVYRRTEAESFRRVISAKLDDEDALLESYHFSIESDTGYVLSNEKTGRFGVYKYDFVKGQIGELVYDNSTNDISDFDLTPDGKALKAIWYTDDRDRVVWFDEALKGHQADIDGALKDRINWIVSRSRDDSRMIVFTSSARDPGSFYLYQPGAGVMRRMVKVNDKLSAAQLAPTQYVKYAARDGLEIPAYLTLPVGRDPKRLPLIILPHGGPYNVRDTLGFDPEVQFLANRGYAVLQSNYRGSESYGEKFYKSGEGQIGRKMQDDLDDGMDWLVKEGIADPKRVCIVGGSYGGYAALWGATRNPERYRCAASFAGVSDYKRQVRYSSQFFYSSRYRKKWQQKVQGDKDFDLDTVSPLKQIDKLKVPVLLVHGDEDTRVPYKQSSLYAAALQKAGKPYEFYTYKGEGHGFSSPQNLQDWLEKLDAFLGKYNPAD